MKIKNQTKAYLHYKISKIMKKNGAFWAFSNLRYEEKKVSGVEYAALNSGLVCPVDNIESLIQSLNQLK